MRRHIKLSIKRDKRPDINKTPTTLGFKSRQSEALNITIICYFQLSLQHLSKSNNPYKHLNRKNLPPANELCLRIIKTCILTRKYYELEPTTVLRLKLTPLHQVSTDAFDANDRYSCLLSYRSTH